MITVEGRPAVEASDPHEAADDARARAFAGLMDRRTLDSAYRYATLILGDPDEAEDAAHDAALSAWRHFAELRDQERFDAWFGRILANACRDRLRANRRVRALTEMPAAREHEDDLGNPPDRHVGPDPTDRIAGRDAIAAGLRRLSVEHREVLVLRFWADLTVIEIAARTGVGPGTVKSRLHYALRNLRASIDADEYGRYAR